VTNPLSTAKEISKLIQEYNDLPLKKKILQLEEEIKALQEDNRSLKQRLENKEGMLPSGPHNYFYKGDVGPYCPKCWQKDGKPVLLPAVEDFAAGLGRQCSVCKGLYVEERARRRTQIKPLY
jgi:hypothetical protein